MLHPETEILVAQAYEALATHIDIIDFKGHWCNGRRFRTEGIIRDDEIFRHRFLREGVVGEMGAVRLIPAWRSAFKEDRIGFLKDHLRVYWDCKVCGEHLQFRYTGDGFVVVSDPCKYPDGVITETELKVPSGKILVANDLRSWYPVEKNHFNVCYDLGQQQTTVAYANVGMAHGFVGNTCPGVYRQGDHFTLGTWDDDEGSSPWGEKVAWVCTDLWWYSIVDVEDFKSRLRPEDSFEEIAAFWTNHVVDVKPGIYVFRQEHGKSIHDAGIDFATFRWDREVE